MWSKIYSTSSCNHQVIIAVFSYKDFFITLTAPSHQSKYLGHEYGCYYIKHTAYGTANMHGVSFFLSRTSGEWGPLAPKATKII